MPATTQIVDIPEEHLADLTAWVQNHRGSIKEWDLVLGKHGHLYLNGYQPSLDLYLRMQVAAQRPEMRCPAVLSMPVHIRRELFQMGADSYDWMNEGLFDEIDLPEIMRIIADVLQIRRETALDDQDERVQYIRSLNGNENLPDWKDMSQAQRALIQEAFVGVQWETRRRLDSFVTDKLTQHLRDLRS